MAAELQPGELDPSQATIVAVIGRKRSGKSKFARWLASSWPHDAVIIDLHGDDRPWQVDVPESGWVELHEVPARWPEHLRADERPLWLYYHPDAGSPTLVEDMDAAAGLAWLHGNCLLLVHEWGALALAHNQRERPMTSRAQSQGSKRKITIIEAMHRPYNIDTLTLVQADVIVVFDTPKKADRERIADDIGWDTDDFHLAHAELGKYQYLQFDRRVEPPEQGEQDLRLLRYPALSSQELDEVLRPQRELDYAGDHELAAHR